MMFPLVSQKVMVPKMTFLFNVQQKQSTQLDNIL